MEWDLGIQGAALLTLISLGFGAAGGLLAGHDWGRRLRTAVIATVACFGAGLLASEWVFGWATEEDLQPNVDGLSRDEVLLSSLLTTAVVVLVVRYVAHRHEGRHALGRHRARPSGHA